MAKDNMINRARDELFSHINRCGVLQAEENDQPENQSIVAVEGALNKLSPHARYMENGFNNE